MRLVADCLPCTLRQLLEAARMSTDDETVLMRIMDEGIVQLAKYGEFRNSPELCRAMQCIVTAHTGNADPYSGVKERDVAAALQIYPMLKQYVSEGDHLRRALKVSATGNVIDSAVGEDVRIESCVMRELQKPFVICDEPVLRQKLKTAKTLLFVGDNAGETVFDRVLLESLPHLEITYAARGGPALNDTTEKEAAASGLAGCARIISTGCALPGVNLDEATDEFLEAFRSADIVICKGQGNYETLGDVGRSAFFLLKAKCVVLSRLLGVAMGDYVFRYIASDSKTQ